MASEESDQLHFLLLPYMSPGHLIPMADIARLLSRHGVTVTIVTTPINAVRIKPIIDHAISSGLHIRLVQLPLPVLEVGLPEGCESLELVPSRPLIRNFIDAILKLQQPFERLVEELEPTPTCFLVDKFHYWAEGVATKFQIPTLLFDGTSCFNLVCFRKLLKSRVYESVLESQPFVVPELPHRMEFTRAQLPMDLNPDAQEFKDFHQKARAFEEGAYGVVVNSFEELESDYVNEYQKAKSSKVWCIGPVSLSYKAAEDTVHRGNKGKVDEKLCINWLDSWPHRSVVYVCLGTLNRLALSQLKELALGLEASNGPFIWVMGEDNTGQVEKWMLEDGFKERTKGRCLLIHGWAPQLLILSHSAVGGFLTHCGWNSTLEAVCAGVPMITWPMFSDQFFNEKLIVQILEIGERLGADVCVPLGKQEKYGAMVQRDKIVQAIDKVMGEGTTKEDRRERARKLAELAKKSMEPGGSSYLNMKILIKDIATLTFGKQPKS